jgi:1,4-dihydroxy-2-naphthoyl-CoA hydrolase
MKKISLRQVDLKDLNASRQNTLVSTLGIEITALGEDFIEGRMPVDSRTHQIYGLLHGGASVALAESLGSLGAHLCVGPGFQCVGIEINANHLRSVTQGYVTGRAVPLHIGKTTHVWDIRIRSEDGKLVCVSRLTVAVREDRRQKKGQ